MESTQHINLEFLRRASYAPELVKSYDHNMESTQHINLEFLRRASYAPELVKSYDHNIPSELNSPGV
jgi:hypothetical protein